MSGMKIRWSEEGIIILSTEKKTKQKNEALKGLIFAELSYSKGSRSNSRRTAKL